MSKASGNEQSPDGWYKPSRKRLYALAYRWTREPVAPGEDKCRCQLRERSSHASERIQAMWDTLRRDAEHLAGICREGPACGYDVFDQLDDSNQNAYSLLVRKRVDDFRHHVTDSIRKLSERFERNVSGVVEAVDSWHQVASHTPNYPVLDITPSAFLRELRALDAEFDGSLSIDRDGAISVITRPITLYDADGGEHALGRFRLVLTRSAIVEKRRLKAIALEPNPACGDADVTHPNVLNNRICYGNASRTIDGLLANSLIYDAFLATWDLLANGNSTNPYVPLEHWDGLPTCPQCDAEIDDDNNHEETCIECNRTGCSECMSKCEECSEYLCPNCGYACEHCGDSFCSEHTVTCSGCCDRVCNSCSDDWHSCEACVDLLCNNCAYPCYECGAVFCSRCTEKCQCDCSNVFCAEHGTETECGHMTCNDCQVEISGAIYCKDCVAVCATCNEPFLPDSPYASDGDTKCAECANEVAHVDE